MSEGRKIRVKKVKRRCDVRRCNSREAYLVSRSVESGNSIIVCRDCLEDALAEIKKLEKGTQENTVPEHETEETSETEVKQETPGVKYACDACGREFTTERGLEIHKRTCKG
ncbi:MAG: hypothetical protein J6N52_03690 [Clostridia bacterium]|nr:hypothetical protein [Clostridia bacterium]